MSIDPTIRDQSLVYFLQEAPELLQVLEQELLSLREDYSITKVHTLMRTTHTLKGATASMGLESITTVAHSLEDIFKNLYKPDIVIDPEVEALLFEGYECLRTPLIAEFSGSHFNNSEIFDRAAVIFSQLQEKLGDCFDQEAYIPTSAELGFDVTQSIFEVGVTQRLEELACVIATGEPQAVASTLQAQAEVFLGLAESLHLPGFGAIASATIAALNNHPDDSVSIAQAALADFQQGQSAVLAGDRSSGGEISLALQQLAGVEEDLEHLSMGALELLSMGAGESVHADSSKQIPSAPLPLFSPEMAAEPTDSLLEAIWNIPESQASPIDAEFGLQPDSVLVTSPCEPAFTLSEPQEPPTFSFPAVASDDQHDDSPVVDADAAPLSGELISPTTQREPTLSDKPEVTQITVGSQLSGHESVSTPNIPKKELVPLSQTVRVNVEHLERLNYFIGELLTNQNRQSLQDEQVQGVIQQLLLQLQQHQQMLNQLRDGFDRMLIQPEVHPQRVLSHHWQSRSQLDPLELDRHSEVHVLLQSVLENAVQLEEATDAIDLFSRQSSQMLEKQRRLLTNARDDLLEARMMPLGDIFSRLPRVLQQLETQHSKPVSLKLSGAEVLVDKAVAEKLYDPLLHLVRNAFDHGIEPVEVRRQQGKAERGQIELRGFHRGSHLMIEVRDDGQGLKFEQIRQRAVERNLVSPEQARNLNEAQLTDLLFEPGFSTASKVNDLSGRGIGLDVVRSQLQALQGSVTAYCEPSRGTAFLLQIPLSLTMAKLFLCQSGLSVYALLTDAIEQIIIPQSNQLRCWEGGKVLRWGKGADERLIPVFQLSSILDYFSPVTQPKASQPTNQNSNASTPRVILLRCQDELLGLEVDQIIGEQELVIRPLGPMIMPPHYVYGGSILADGRLSLVIDGAALGKYVFHQKSGDRTNSPLVNFTPQISSSHDQATGGRLRYLEPSDGESPLSLPAQPDSPTMPTETLLLVDDSITVRQSLALTLQKSGYQVIQARDGCEAIEQLRAHPAIRLVICDIEMPRMNGFEFLNYRRQDQNLEKIPVVMLTSRSGEKHRLIAKELGAMGYMNKPYLESQILATVSDLLDKNAVNFVLS